MEIIKSDTHFNFVSLMKPAIFVSVAFILIGIASIVWHSGLNYGIDFAGGTLVQIKFHKETPTNRIRDALKMINLGSSIIQPFGLNEVIVRIAQSSTNDQDPSVRIKDALGAALGQGSFEIRRVEVVGPKVSKDLTRKAILAVIFSWIGILVYVGIRFEFRYALAGVMALLNKEFDLNIVAALLTIIGYSINDTIVIFDRIRENSRKNMKMALSDVVNLSVNQTLSRTLLTSLTVFMVLLILFFFGGAVIHDFTFAMLVGTVAGVYSTVFIASPLILAFERIKPSKIRLKRGK
jgi:preprotein translocase subunit SecF